MTTTMMKQNEAALGAAVERDVGLPGRVVVSWTVAGGLAVGGFLVGGMMLAGKLSGSGLLLAAGALYIIGGLLGFGHGAALGILGRPEGMSAREAVAKVAMGAIYAVPALIVGFLAAGWIAMTSVALYIGKPLPMVGAAVGWLVGLVLVVVAAVSGWEALRHAYARWPERRLGTVLVTATFGALLVLFMADRPELWGLRLRVTEVGAVLLAAVGAFWIAGPAVTLALMLRRRLQAARALVPVTAERTPRVLASVAMGLAAGALLGVLAVPFQQAAFAGAPDVGTVGGAVLVASRAIVDEVLLRLFLVTAVVWGLVRWQNVPRGKAAVYAVTVAAAAQVLIYMPGINAIGFATLQATLAYVAMTVAVPAIVFGVLYWKRGIGTALVAHATALAALALML
ncbi:MAG TPA: hypothetical protein VK929_10415 [Longimicrobiales bacterium]|nr:hypothetical protein [Longimicrobiales bacterium]